MTKVLAGYSTKGPAATTKKASNSPQGKKNHAIQVRPIGNGWIVKESYEDGKGRWVDNEMYHETNPMQGKPKAKDEDFDDD